MQTSLSLTHKKTHTLHGGVRSEAHARLVNNRALLVELYRFNLFTWCTLVFVNSRAQKPHHIQPLDVESVVMLHGKKERSCTMGPF